MFFNTEMLTKRGPLAKVWLASHVSSKLTKSTLLSTSISSSVEAILGPAFIQTIALRLSGQLLLGVTRIYSRKTKYLLEDCNETLAKVKKAFRPGQVDLEDGGLNIAGESRNKEAVTLRTENGAGGFEDILAGFDDWDNDLAPLPHNAVAGNSKSKSKNIAKLADITLVDQSLDFGLYDDNAHNEGAYGFDFGPDGALGDEYELDLGFGDEFEMDLGFGGEEGGNVKGKGKKRARDNNTGELSDIEADAEGEEDDEDRSVEAGRDAAGSQAHASARGSSIAPRFDEDGDIMMGNDGKDDDFMNGGGENIDDMGMDFGDFGGGGEEDRFDREKTPQTNADLTESYGLTPKTAADLLVATQATKATKKANLRKQVVDKSIQLDVSKINKENLFVDPQFLPSSRLHLLLLQTSESNLPSPYLPIPLPALAGSKSTSTNWFTAAPLGLAPELTALFKFPSRKSKIEEEKKVAKALRIANGDAEEVEIDEYAEVELGRREASREMSLGYIDDMNYGGGGKEDEEGDQAEGYDPMGGDDFQFDLGGEEEAGAQVVLDPIDDSSALLKNKKKKQKLDHPSQDDDEEETSATQSRYAISGILEEEIRTLSLGPLAIFDTPAALGSNQQQSSTQQTGTQAQSMGETEEDAIIGGIKGEGEGNWKAGKWSKNTVKALEVLKNELGTEDDEDVQEEEVVKKMEFETVAKQATRRAAAAFFFELLVLSTRDCIKIEQSSAYGSITVMAKDKLFEVAQSQAV